MTETMTKAAAERAQKVFRDPQGKVVLPLEPGEPPLELDWPALAGLLKDRKRIEGQIAEVLRARNTLQNGGIQRAAEEDRRELADKLRREKRDLGDQDRREREAKDALVNAERRYGALTTAAALVEDEIAALVGSEAPRWLKQIRSREKAATKRLSAAAKELVSAHEELGAAGRLRRWLEGPSVRTKPGFVPQLAVHLGHDLPNGDPATLDTREFVGMLLAQETEASA